MAGNKNKHIVKQQSLNFGDLSVIGSNRIEKSAQPRLLRMRANKPSLKGNQDSFWGNMCLGKPENTKFDGKIRPV